ncbi:hypothetical protein [Vogesella indigofera]|uniref:hypothetical protein n=1 Tax=Vogesella indigofera TaxID=45465 RepID=UPI003F43A3FB
MRVYIQLNAASSAVFALSRVSAQDREPLSKRAGTTGAATRQRLFFWGGWPVFLDMDIAAMRLADAIFDITKSNEKINLYRF